jgi:hypothetical protein
MLKGDEPGCQPADGIKFGSRLELWIRETAIIWMEITFYFANMCYSKTSCVNTPVFAPKASTLDE